MLRPGEPRQGRYVLYWMQSAVRSRHNQALDYAVAEANRLGLPVLVVFGLTPSYPSANARHYQFLLEGLRDVYAGLGARKLPLLVGLTGEHGPAEAALALAPDAALIVTERAYLRHLRGWRERLSTELERLYPDLPLADARLRMGRIFVQGFIQTLLGRVVAPILHCSFMMLLLARGLTGMGGMDGAIWAVIYITVLGLGYGSALAMTALGLQRLGKSDLLPAQALLPFYWLLIGWATLRAAHELLTRPFYCFKSPHRPEAGQPRAERARRTSAKLPS